MDNDLASLAINDEWDIPRYTYAPGDQGELWWCNSHQRRATYVFNRKDHCCAPGLGGIMIPCHAVNLTGIAELED